MPPAVRFGEVCTGHSCFGSRPNVEGSGDVIINGLPAHRKADHWATHCCGPSCHDSVACSGSGDVLTNGRDQERVGDPVCCGSAMATGSPDVFVN